MKLSLRVTDAVVIPGDDLEWKAVRASGPGGQNVNKVSSKVALRFDLPGTMTLDAGTKGRLALLAKGKLDKDGKILLASQATRDQAKNLDDACEKLAELVRAALVKPKKRRATRPSRGAKERRLGEKKRVGEKKRGRSTGADD